MLIILTNHRSAV